MNKELFFGGSLTGQGRVLGGSLMGEGWVLRESSDERGGEQG